jgi:preprotein translocase subunit SecD
MNDVFPRALLAIVGFCLASAACGPNGHINYQSSLANTEFRFVADPAVDVELVRESIHAQEREVQLAGRAAGKWVECMDQRVPLCRRVSSKRKDGRAQQILVVLDRHNVTGADFESVEPGTCHGSACVLFRFTESGGQRFGSLTEENLDRQLVIVLDEEVVAAHIVRSRISERGQIDSHFTREQVLSLIEEFYGSKD